MNHNDLVDQWAAEFSFKAKIDGYKIPKNIEKYNECVVPIKNEATKEIIKRISKAITSYSKSEKIPLTIKIVGEEVYSNKEEK